MVEITKRLSNLWTIIRKELEGIKNEKTIVLAIFVQIIIASLSSFLFVGIVSPQSHTGTTIEIGVTGDVPTPFLETENSVDGVELLYYSDRYVAISEFTSAELDAVIITSIDDNQLEANILVPKNSFKSTFVVSSVKDIIQKVEDNERIENTEHLRVSPLDKVSSDKTGGSTYFTFIYTILIPLLVFLPVFIGGSIASDLLVEEIEKGSLEVLKSAPVTVNDIINAKIISTVLLSVLQAIVWMLLIKLNGITINNLFGILLVVIGFSFSLSSVGILLAAFYKDREKTQILYSAVVIGVFSLLLLLPENPINTLAKLSIGNPSQATWLYILLYLFIGFVLYIGTLMFSDRFI